MRGIDVRQEVVASIAPSAARWIESDWSRPVEYVDPGAVHTALADPVPVVVAAEGHSAVTGGAQRFLLVGSGGWMLSYITDIATSIGGEPLNDSSSDRIS